jgi:hypothetical protein
MATELPAGQRYEKLAFTFCKAATVCLLCGRYALPVAASLAAVFYVAAWRRGVRETRCILRYPLLIAAFWITVVGIWYAGQSR